MRVTDDMVHDYLVWAANYGEIASFTRVANCGRKWAITLPEGATITPSGMEVGFLERTVAPAEMVLSNREALAFGMGCAVAGDRPEGRRAFAAREWGWHDAHGASA